MDINQLRVLNDYLNQTIDALSRQQWGAYASPISGLSGLSHSQFQYTPFGGGMPSFGTPFNTPFGNASFSPFGMPSYGQSSIIDPFLVNRGLSHTPVSTMVNPWTALNTEIARQSQLTNAIAARQQVLEAIWRAAGIPL